MYEILLDSDDSFVCPYCKEKNKLEDLWEWGEGESVIECQYCDKKLDFVGEVSIDYSVQCTKENHKWAEETPHKELDDKLKSEDRKMLRCEYCEDLDFVTITPEEK